MNMLPSCSLCWTRKYAKPCIFGEPDVDVSTYAIFQSLDRVAPRHVLGLTQYRFCLRPAPLESVTRPLTQLPVVGLQRPLQYLLRLLVRHANRHEIPEVVEARLARPRRLVHGFPYDPRDIRELV
jgi:hypothetical protein